MSALTNEWGLVPINIDNVRHDGNVPGFGGGVIDASTEKAAFIGYVWHPTVKTGSINIRKVHFRCGAVTFNAASVLRVSLQNISATAGPPFQPDGTQDQTADMTAVTANAWNTTGALSADRTVNLANDSLGDADSRWVAVVFEFQTFTAADSVLISGITTTEHRGNQLGGNQILNTGSWAVVANTVPVIVLECADGTFAFLSGSVPFSALSYSSVSSTGAIRRAGVKFKFPTQRKIDRAALLIDIPNGCDGTLTLYDSDGTTELVSVDVDNDSVYAAGAGAPRTAEIAFEPITLAADTFYYFTFNGGTSTAARIYYGDVADAAHMDGLFYGQQCHHVQHDGTSWSATTTRRPHFGFGFSAFHDGAGGAGGLLTHPGMAGGMRG